MARLIIAIWLLVCFGLNPLAQACGIGCTMNTQKHGISADHSCCQSKSECIQSALVSGNFHKENSVKISFNIIELGYFQPKSSLATFHKKQIFHSPFQSESIPIYLKNRVLRI